MLREGLADLKRYRQDKRTNAIPCHKVKDKNTRETTKVKSQDLKVGDVIELHDDDNIPADCIPLWTS